MEQAIQVLMDYAAAFEQTYIDDDWTRVAPFFAEDASYEVRGGPLACKIIGREGILHGLKKSIDGLDRRCDDRIIKVTGGPQATSTDDGYELSIDWHVSYQYGDAPQAGFAGHSVVNIADGVIVALRDEYAPEEMERFGAWMLEYGEGLDGSYV